MIFSLKTVLKKQVNALLMEGVKHLLATFANEGEMAQSIAQFRQLLDGMEAKPDRTPALAGERQSSADEVAKDAAEEIELAPADETAKHPSDETANLPEETKEFPKESTAVSKESTVVVASPMYSTPAERLQMIEAELEAKDAASQETPKDSFMADAIKRLLVHLHKRYKLRYNVLTETTEIGEPVNQKMIYRPLNSRDFNTICVDAQISNIGCWEKDMKHCLESKYVEKFHPFESYFKQLPEWDGVDRVEALAKRVSEKPIWVAGFHTWMLGMVAQWLQINNNSNDLEHGHSLAPILISTEQGWGKSTFCEMLLPKELRDYYTDSFNILLPNACEHKMAKNGLINMDEYDSISKSKQAALKTLMQKSTLKYKIGNSKAFTQVKRLASFIGTTNRRDVIVDPTGSRRFLCVELEHPIDVQTPLDYAQLYAQLKQELLEGRQHWLTDAQEDAIQEDNLQFKRVSAAEQLFFETFRFAEPHAEGAISLNAPQIFTILQKENPAALRGTTPNAFYSLMASWKRCYHTHAGNRYWVERLPKS
jgi:hypothetical protein